MLSELQCQQIEKALAEKADVKCVAAYLCLHLGLAINEASALRVSDFDQIKNTLRVANSVVSEGKGKTRINVLRSNGCERTLALPEYVADYLLTNLCLYSDPSSFLVSGGIDIPGPYIIQNLLVSINTKKKIADSLTAVMLRQAFIRRCLESNIDLYTIAEYTGIKQVSEIQKKYSQYISPKPEQLDRLRSFSHGTVAESSKNVGKRMNLLILGAGSQGHVVKEIAEALGVFDEIAFLDDDKKNAEAIDTCQHYKYYLDRYPIALPSFGDCPLRAKWMERIEEAGFIIPKLIHPMATISPSAFIEAGSTVEAKAIVGTNSRIGKGCIISSGAIVDPSATVCQYCHIDSSSTVKKGAYVPTLSKVQSGMIYSTEQNNLL